MSVVATLAAVAEAVAVAQTAPHQLDVLRLQEAAVLQLMVNAITVATQVNKAPIAPILAKMGALMGLTVMPPTAEARLQLLNINAAVVHVPEMTLPAPLLIPIAIIHVVVEVVPLRQSINVAELPV